MLDDVGIVSFCDRQQPTIDRFRDGSIKTRLIYRRGRCPCHDTKLDIWLLAQLFPAGRHISGRSAPANQNSDNNSSQRRVLSTAPAPSMHLRFHGCR